MVFNRAWILLAKQANIGNDDGMVHAYPALGMKGVPQCHP